MEDVLVVEEEKKNLAVGKKVARKGGVKQQ